MTINQESTATGKIKLTITIGPDKYEQYLRGTALRLGEKMNVPGFRAGRVPYEILKKRIGEMALLGESLNTVVRETYTKAVKEQKIHPALPPTINVTKVAPGNPIEYTAEIVVLPGVKFVEFKKITVKAREVAVEDKEVEDALRELQRMRATESKKDGAAQMGDKVECDITSIVEADKSGSEETAKNQSLVLGETSMVEGFAQEVVGMRANESKTFKLTFPKKYHKPEYAGKEVTLTVKVHVVWTIKQPELNDSFAASVNKEFNDLESLKKQLRKNIEFDKKRQVQDALERDMLEQLIQKSTIDEPAEELVGHVSERMVHELKHSIEQKGGKWDEYLKHAKKSENELKSGIATEAKKRIGFDSIITTVVDQESLTVSKEEIEQEANQLLGMYANARQAREKINLPELKENIHGRLLNRKAIEFLKSKIIPSGENKSSERKS